MSGFLIKMNNLLNMQPCRATTVCDVNVSQLLALCCGDSISRTLK
jgi:hypothetical protein